MRKEGVKTITMEKRQRGGENQRQAKKERGEGTRVVEKILVRMCRQGGVFKKGEMHR